jgi:Holliday junction resolvase
VSKRKGSVAERKAIKLLEAEGFVCTKAGGSLGVFDVIALGAESVRCVQVKSGGARLSRGERQAIAALQLAPNVTKEYWSFRDYARAPLIERL